MTSQIPFTPLTPESMGRLTLDEQLAFEAAACAVAGDQKPSLEVTATLVLAVQRLITGPVPDAAAAGQPASRSPGWPGRCEDRQSAGEPCGAEAPYVVSVGQRRHDAQASCGIHLAATMTALEGAEGRRADITIRAGAQALMTLAEAAADRDRFREQARIVGEDKAEWLCEACEVIHPWRDGDRFTAACPDCGWPMTPTRPSLRSADW